MKFAKLSLAVFILDRLTKFLVRHFMFEGESIPIIENVFHLTYYRNPGAAFSLFEHKRAFFIVVTMVILGVILYYYFNLPEDKKAARFALALQFGGAVGNLVDRILSGYVVDFLDFRFWPVFNIADSAIFIGVFILCWEILTWPKEEDKPHHQQEN